MAFTFVMLPPQKDVYRAWGLRLAAALPELNVVVAEDTTEAERAIEGADGAFGSISPTLMSKARRLRWLQAPAAAPPAGYYFPELVAHPVTVTNMREIYNDHIGAHVMAYVLAFARGLAHYIPLQLRREWKPLPPDTGVIHLPGSTMLIVGAGGIGAEVARLAKAFAMTVLATDARRTSPPPGVDELYGPDQLDRLLPRADFVVLTVPHTPETEGFMDRSRFQRMKPSAFFINIGRGRTTCLADLVASPPSGIPEATSRSGERSSRIQIERPWVPAMRSLPRTIRSKIGVTGRFSWNGCQCWPSSNDTYSPVSVPA